MIQLRTRSAEAFTRIRRLDTVAELLHDRLRRTEPGPEMQRAAERWGAAFRRLWFARVALVATPIALPESPCRAV